MSQRGKFGALGAEAVALQIDDANHHASFWIEWEITESEAMVEVADIVIQRVSQNAIATDLAGKAQGCRESEKQQRPCAAVTLMPEIDSKLP